MGRPGFTLGIGPSHRSNVTGTLGLSYDHPGRSTEEYLRILTPLLRGEGVDVEGEDWRAHVPGGAIEPAHPVPVLLSALAPRMLRVAGEQADGTICWMAPRPAIEEHVVPRITEAAAATGRPAPRIVVGLPVAVHDDIDEAREAVGQTAVMYEHEPNYRRAMASGGAARAADAAIVGDEAAVEKELRALVDAGATDLWLFVVGVAPDRRSSRERAMELLKGLASE